jgi:DNA-binding protein H-NS
VEQSYRRGRQGSNGFPAKSAARDSLKYGVARHETSLGCTIGVVAALLTPLYHAAQTKSELENSMAKKRKKQIARKRKKQNLAGMNLDELMSLRGQIDTALSGHRSTLEKQLASLGGSVTSFGGAALRERRSSLKGTKVAAKYRGPEGETWAGRGATPRWMTEATKGTGKKREDFLIDKSGARTVAKRRNKK